MDFEREDNTSNILLDLITLYLNRDYEKLCKILDIEYNPNYDCDNDVIRKYYNEGMIFTNDDNPLKIVRVYADEETKKILNTISMVIYNSIDEKTMNDLIINKWIEKFAVIGRMNKEDIIRTDENVEYVRFGVGEKTWRDLSVSCRNKSIYIKDGLKMAVMNYINEINDRII